jgi:hypothetical protein
MTNPVIYLIWYGNWTGNTAITIIENFAKNIGSTAWWNITRRYNNTAPITFGGSTYDSYSQGRSLSNINIFSIVSKAINTAALPQDTNGIYLVLTSADVTEQVFCTLDCGWHTYSWISNVAYVYGWVGNAEQQCPGSCIYWSPLPNNNPGADGMVNVIAHELAESASDPYLNAWYGTGCQDESGDKCDWNFGQTSTLTNGATYNIVVNGYKYLIQQNWRIDTQSCSMS